MELGGVIICIKIKEDFMSHHHHNGQCCHGKQCSSCGCCSSHKSQGCSCSCHEGTCNLQGEGHEHGDFAHQLLELADEAWMEVLKEKIKEEVKKSNGPHLDQLAKLASESNNERWKHKLSSKKVACCFKDKLDDLMSCDKNNKKS